MTLERRTVPVFRLRRFLSEFVAAETFFAGWSGIMVNLSDIAAMGGRPIAVAVCRFRRATFICGDTDGLLAIAPDEIERVHNRAALKYVVEQRMLETIRAGADDRF